MKKIKKEVIPTIVGILSLTLIVGALTNTFLAVIRTPHGTTTKKITIIDTTSPDVPAETTAPTPAPSNTGPGTKLSSTILEKLELEQVEEEKAYYAFATPNDPIYPQWFTNVTSAPTGWDTTTGSASTIIAVIDTGFALDHEDLNAAWYTNSAEQGTTQNGDTCWTGSPQDKQTNGCDDDQNGYIDDWRGWDFSNNDNYSQAGDNYAGGANHGTKVSGLIGARGNNSIGIAGVNWSAQLMPLQALYDEGFGYSSDIAAAVVYATDAGASVINLSLGGPSFDNVIYAAIRYATDRNVTVVASSGNCGTEQSSEQCLGFPSPGGMGYPARYKETIAVGATTESDSRASFSSYGAELDIVAPGSGTIQTTNWLSSNQTTAYSSSAYGTSFAAPIVSGLVGLLKAEDANLAKDEILALLITGTDATSGMLGQQRTDEYGYGRINMNKALNNIATYHKQLLKTDGTTLNDVTSQAPYVATNRGHSLASTITGGSDARTICKTAPNTNCTLKLTKGTTVVDLGTRQTNTQGVVTWLWNADDLPSTGDWLATTKVGNLTSSSEPLYIR